MIPEKYPVFGVKFCSTDYDEASELIISKAKSNTSYTVSALAVHGLTEAYKNPQYKEVVNAIDMVLPDGQPIKWTLNSYYKLHLKDRVSGPDLTLYVLDKANKYKLKLFLYGSTKNTLDKFSDFIKRNYPEVEICGIHPDRFRDASLAEDQKDIEQINNSGAHIVFVGRGCPRQEYWVAAHKDKVNAAMMAIGAAFDFHAGVLKRAPKWMQDSGLEWLYRMIQEPGRMWKRNLNTFPLFIYLYLKYKFFKKDQQNI